MFTISPGTVSCYQFPDDATLGHDGLIAFIKAAKEVWFRAYGFTMMDLVDELISLHNGGVPIHLFLDHSQEMGHFEKPLAQKLVDAGVEVTVGTSYAGIKYIMHQKGFVTSDGVCWEGSVNFSNSGWEQVNSAMVFSSTDWRDHFIESFKKDVDYAWANELAMQLMPQKPTY